jgi:hypothetical protein
MHCSQTPAYTTQVHSNSNNIRPHHRLHTPSSGTRVTAQVCVHAVDLTAPRGSTNAPSDTHTQAISKPIRQPRVRRCQQTNKQAKVPHAERQHEAAQGAHLHRPCMYLFFLRPTQHRPNDDPVMPSPHKQNPCRPGGAPACHSTTAAASLPFPLLACTTARKTHGSQPQSLPTPSPPCP